MKRFISLAMIIIMLFVSSCTRGNDALDENGVVKDETARSEETGGEISADTNDDEQPDKDANAYVPEKDTTQNENKDKNPDGGKNDSTSEQETYEPEIEEPEQQENESKDASFDKPQEQPEPPE